MSENSVAFPAKLRLLTYKCLILSLTIFLFYNTASATEKPLSLATGNNFPPFADENLPSGGMVTEIITEIFKLSNIPHTVIHLPWKRTYQEARVGVHDGIFPYYETEKRKKSFLFSDPLYATKASIFVSRDLLQTPSSEAELDGLRFCRAEGYSIPEELRDQVNSGKINVIRTLENTYSLRMLLIKRCDFVVWNNIVSADMFRREKGSEEKLKRLPIEWAPSTMHFLISKQHPNAEAIIQTVNTGLKTLKETGVYDTIVDRHLNRPSE
ncbi:substrate-binding periplasmic protein [Sneathiella glossodoripedis]|uniref:substrate-binding periplasmic protein n=1 Tax=Sneathiella glossodoripedis TaxID=418853 RepID=UPI0004719ED8|nr:transporter substrate-binding domain-containing protein [Sneathiella glossodoripedis]